LHTIFWLENLYGTDSFGNNPRVQDNIQVDIEEIGHEGVDWIHLTQDKVQ
jgi:hypothetical protein